MHIEASVARTLSARDRDDGAVATDATLVDPALGLLAVADGTHGAAEVAIQALAASSEALHEAAACVAEDASSAARLGVGRVLEQAVLDAHEALGDHRGHASLTAAMVAGHHATVASVGLCRAYLVRDGAVRRLTTDHSVAAERVRSGRLSAAEAVSSPLRFRVARTVGGTHELDVDLAEVALSSGDQLLLCTDGLHSSVSDDLIHRALARDDDPEAGVRRLLAVTHDADDRSAVLAQVETDAEQAVLAEIAAVMAETFLFRDLDEQQRALVAPYLEHRFLDPGQVLFEEGEMGDTFYVVVDGTLRIRRGEVHLVDVSTGGHFGELCLARLARRSATVEAIDEALVFGLRRDRFQQIVERRPTVGARIAIAALDQLGNRVRDLTDRLAARESG